jgi:hypothetical protein
VVLERARRLGFAVPNQLSTLNPQQRAAVEEDLRRFPSGDRLAQETSKLHPRGPNPGTAAQAEPGDAEQPPLAAFVPVRPSGISPMTDTKRRDMIRAYCATRRIDTLVHFTRLENLVGILAEGILPRSTLEGRPSGVIFNDDIRTDNHKEAVCLSISFPNYKMFYKYRQADQTTI